jgi:hypothetical protein
MGGNLDGDDTGASSKGGAKNCIFAELDARKPSVKPCNLKQAV